MVSHHSWLLVHKRRTDECIIGTIMLKCQCVCVPYKRKCYSTSCQLYPAGNELSLQFRYVTRVAGYVLIHDISIDVYVLLCILWSFTVHVSLHLLFLITSWLRHLYTEPIWLVLKIVLCTLFYFEIFWCITNQIAIWKSWWMSDFLIQLTTKWVQTDRYISA